MKEISKVTQRRFIVGLNEEVIVGTAHVSSYDYKTCLTLTLQKNGVFALLVEYLKCPYGAKKFFMPLELGMRTMVGLAETTNYGPEIEQFFNVPFMILKENGAYTISFLIEASDYRLDPDALNESE